MDELTLLTTVFNQLFEDLSTIGMHIKAILKPFLCCCGSSTGGHAVEGYCNVKILYTVSTSRNIYFLLHVAADIKGLATPAVDQFKTCKTY